MCGLVGIFSSEMDEDLKNAFRWLHQIDVVRGNDSSGVLIHYPKQGKINACHVISKDVGPPINMWLSDKNEEVFDETGLIVGNPDLLMGHNRKTTFGATSKENAHPFKFGSIVGAHNGTLKRYSLTKFGNDSLPVDSMRMFKAISDSIDEAKKDKWHESVNSVLTNIEGAIAATWYQYTKGVLNVYRNNERPLHYCLSKNGKTLVWASESWMIDTALVYSGTEDRFNPTNEYPEFTLRRFHLGKGGVVRLVEPEELIFHRQTFTNTANNTDKKNENYVEKKTGEVIPFDPKTKTVEFNFVVRGVCYQNEKEFWDKFECRCSACSDELSIDDRVEFGFPTDYNKYGRNMVLCPTCMDAGWVTEFFGHISTGYEDARNTVH